MDLCIEIMNNIGVHMNLELLKNNLYISTIDKNAIDLSKKYNAGLELCQFTTTSNLEGEYFKYWFEQAMECKKSNSKLLFHAPFNEIYPSSIDEDVRELAMKKLNRAFDISYNYLDIKKMIVHSGYVNNVYFHQWFVEKSIIFWKRFMINKPNDFELCIENVFDDKSEYLSEIIDGINDERVGICIDIGHANVVSDKDVLSWIDEFGKRIKHVHLHNNYGVNDEHGEICDGNMDVEKLLIRLMKLSQEKKTIEKNELTYTLETRNTEKSIKYMLSL